MRIVALAVFGLTGLLPAGCRGRSEARSLEATAPAPAPGDRGLCADVKDLRVCWIDGSAPDRGGCSTSGGQTICVEPRRLPRRPAPPMGWRCFGDGESRSCVDRRLGAGGFDCSQRSCLQRYPRMPDDSEWECIDLDGVVMCRRGVPPAGVVPGPADPGWLCGPRGNVDIPERICVDFAPDLPDRLALRGPTLAADSSQVAVESWRCRYDHQRREQRRCSRGLSPLATRCSSSADCGDSLVCAGDYCVPRRPQVSCWFDKDCGSGSKCLVGSCEVAQ